MQTNGSLAKKAHWHLIGYDFFNGLTANERDIFYAASKRISLKRNELLFTEGEMAYSCYYIEEGVIQGHRDNSAGKSAILFIRGKGDLFGLADLLNKGVRKCSVRAMTPVVVYELHEQGFEHFLMSSPVLTRKMMEVMGRRIRYLNEQVQDLMDRSVAERLLKLFACLSYEGLLNALPDNQSVPVPIRITQEEMASMIGSCQQTISTTLRALQEQGILTIEGRNILLQNPAALLKALELDG